MPYTLYKSNGLKLTVVDDGTLNVVTSLSLVGQNYSGYGQVINQNLVKLLESFASSTAPDKALPGQLWYDSTNKKMKYYDGDKWNQVVTANISTSKPLSLVNGELWFDSVNRKLYIKYENSYILIGPGAGGGSGGTSGSSSISTSQITADTDEIKNVIEFTIDDTIEAIVSTSEFNVKSDDPVIAQYTKIKNGITLQGANPVTGVSSSTNVYFWGTAADSLRLAGSPATDYVKSTDINIVAGSITSLGNITYISSGSPTTPGQIDGAWRLTVGSTLQATYADLAERYEADNEYEPGTVLVIGGEKEVTISRDRCDTRVAGIVSTNPAYMLNSEAGSDKTHPYIALKGRVPCKVVGNIRKGDLLITSAFPGAATAMTNPDITNPNAVLGRALENYNSGEVGIIEVMVN